MPEKINPRSDTLELKSKMIYIESIIEIGINRLPSRGIQIGFVGEQVQALGYNAMIANYPNQIFSSALDLNTLMQDITLMAPNREPEVKELSEAAKKALAVAIYELENGPCKTFSNIDELFEDLESD